MPTPSLRRPAVRLLLAVLAATPVAAGAQRTVGAPPWRQASSGMVRLPAGTVRPLYATGATPVTVTAFTLDVNPVTRAEYLAFVRANPRWRREAVARTSPGYLTDWPGARDVGTALDARRPVTSVSLPAARAYCAARGKRLPTLDEWEYAAAASETARDASGDLSFVQQVMTMYATRPYPLPPVDRGERNAFGVRGLHGLGWEWVDDVGTAAEAHAHASGQAHDAYCASAAVGATDPNNYPAFLRFAVRSGLSPESTLPTLGFRCAA